MRQRTRLLLFVQGAAFIAAALTHFGVLINGYEHRKAGTAESVIGSVLLAGLALTLMRPGSTRIISITAQSFALLGTAVGLFTIAIGVGPRTLPDLIFHAGIVIALVSGLFATTKAPRVGANADGRA